LKQSAVSALKWNYVGMAARSVSGLLIGVVLARLLGPKPFGQVAIAMLVISLGNLMADFGFSAALVQKKEISDRDIRFGFSVQVLLGAALTVLCIVLAPFIASAFHQPEVAPVIRALGAMFFLQAVGQTAMGLLKRDLAFKSLQTAQVVSYLFGYLALGVPLAYLGFGVWALVLAQLCQTALNTGMVYLSTRHAVLPLFRHDGSMVRFGSKVIGTNVVNWTIVSLDTAIASRFFSVFDLGLYSRAYVFAGVPFNAVSVLQNVLFSTYSRVQDRPEVLRRIYRGSVAIVGVAMFPLYAAIAITPATVLTALYGPKWSGAAPLLTAFAVAMSFHAAMAIAGPLLWGIGRPGIEFRAQAIAAVAAVVIFAAFSRISLTALAWGVALTYALRCILVTGALLRVLHLSWVNLVGGLRGAGALALATAACVWCTDAMLLRHGSGPFLRLAADGTVGAAVDLGILLLAPSAVLGSDAAWLLNSLRGSLPHFINQLLPRGDTAQEGRVVTGRFRETAS
jgi:PST family polysaccharide transporter